jgi:hypothetical protein
MVLSMSTLGVTPQATSPNEKPALQDTSVQKRDERSLRAEEFMKRDCRMPNGLGTQLDETVTKGVSGYSKADMKQIKSGAGSINKCMSYLEQFWDPESSVIYVLRRDLI